MADNFRWHESFWTNLSQRGFWLGIALMTLYRYYLAAHIPLGNDEAYYWDWGRQLQLSYIDHPPGVAWLSAASQTLFPGLLAARGLVPLIHLGATLLLLGSCVTFLKRSLSGAELFLFFAFTQIAPVFSLGGIMLMPDVGLLLGLSLALLCALLIVTAAKTTLMVYVGMGLGLAIALCFKYHSIPIGGGMVVAVAVATFPIRREAWPKLIVSLVVAGLGILPVVIWNWQNGWVSFVFQSSHGFGKLALKPRYALQAVVGLTVFLTPFFLWRFGVGVKELLQKWRSPESLVLLLSAVPLLLLLIGLGMIKQVLPHWFVPCLWLLIPGAVMGGQLGRFFRWNQVLVVLLLIVIPVAMASEGLRRIVVDLTGRAPGGLGELTMWPDVQKVIAEKAPGALVPGEGQPCPEVTLGSLRWFWVAQMSHQLPGQPRIVSFDLNRLSYYSFRDQLQDWVGCPIIIVGSKRHYNKEALQDFLDIASESEVVLEHHQDRTAVIVQARIKKAPAGIKATYY